MDLFPFEKIRKGQKEFMEDVDKTLKERKILLAHAPTGVGKTAGVLTPCIKHALENNKKVIFLTPRHSQHEIALKTIKMIKEKSKENFSAFDLIGKKWMCNIDEVDRMSNQDFLEYCRSLRKEDKCPFYNNTFTKSDKKLKNRAKKVIDDLKGKIMSSEEVKEISKEFCPYEILMQLAGYSKVIICDYFHLFHSKVRGSMFMRANIELEDAIIIVDEAHNLPDRIRKLLSSQISNLTVKRAIKESQVFGFYEIHEKLIEFEKLFLELFRELKGNSEEKFIERNALLEKVESISSYEDFIIDLEMIANEVRNHKRRSYCGSIAEFLRKWNSEDDGYVRIMKIERYFNKRRLRVILKCLNPAISSSNVLNKSYSSILMSGTLTPLEMYRDILGIEKNRCAMRIYHSDFPSENRLNLIVNSVTTKYSKRDENQFRKIAHYISKCSNAIKGNVGVFFPSYYLRDKISEFLNTDKQIIFERPGRKKDRLKLLKEFERLKDKGALLLGVFRGSFDQGIDYPGDLMNGVILVGLPLEKPDLETQALINYYDLIFKRGWDYGYIYPAMNLAIQASGRCIRSESDKGVAVFIDERYLWGNYRKAFPPEMKLKVSKTPWKDIEEFWKKFEE